MSNGKTVITSRQGIELPKITYEIKEVKKDIIIWKFKTEDEAIRASRLFMNSGFDMVRRLI